MLSAAPGVELGLDELLEMRHRLHEARLFSSQNRRSPLVGLHHSRLRGRGVDFDQVRIYQPGDDVRTIDWRVTARTREPHTKLFHEERERPVFVLVEQSQRLFFGSGLCFKAVLAARAAAFIGWSALAHNDRIGGLVFSDRDCHEIKPRRSKVQPAIAGQSRAARDAGRATWRTVRPGPAPRPRSAAPGQPDPGAVRRAHPQ